MCRACLCSHEELTYKRFLQHVFEAASHDSQPFLPKFLMADFEKSISAAAWSLGITMRFCLFHFIQAIIRLLNQKEFVHLDGEDRRKIIGRTNDDESKRESIAYKMHFADNALEFDAAVAEIKEICEKLHKTMVERWVGEDHHLAKKWFRAFMSEEQRQQYPQVRIRHPNAVCE
jgi:hypothetical protein